MRHGWTNWEKIETNCNCGFLKLENLRWTFCTLGQWFCPNFRAECLYKSEETWLGKGLTSGRCELPKNVFA